MIRMQLNSRCALLGTVDDEPHLTLRYLPHNMIAALEADMRRGMESHASD